MKPLRKLSTSLEAISFQYHKLLFEDISIILNNLLADRNSINDKALKNSDIAKVIKDRTGLNITLKLDKSDEINAYVYPPDVDKNNPLISDFWRNMGVVSSETSLKKIKKGSPVLKGEIDLKKSKVSGFYSEINCEVYITRGAFTAPNLIGEEIAAILLHELGHIFSYFTMLEAVMTTNVILLAATNDFFETTDRVRRHQIIDETNKALDIKIDDPDQLVQVDKREVFQTIVLTKMLRDNKSGLGSSTYDYTSWETASDQFATRHGAGRHLVTGLDKLYRSGNSRAYYSTFKHLFLNVVGIAMIVGALVIHPLTMILAVLYLITDPTVKIYDDPEARLARIRREMVASLKDSKISSETKKRITQEIAIVDTTLTQLTDRRGWLELIYTEIIPWSRKQHSQLKFQLELEKLVNNDLFLISAKFDSLNVKVV